MADNEEEEVFTLMCGKCGDVYRVSKEYQAKYESVRWRCRTCVMAWL